MFLSIEDGQFFFSPNTWQMLFFLNPLDALIPNILFSQILGPGHLRAQHRYDFWGARQLSVFFGGGLARGLYPTPPPPRRRKPVHPEVYLNQGLGHRLVTMEVHIIMA